MELSTEKTEITYMKFMKDKIGWTEFDHDKELSVYWKYTNVTFYKTVIGTEHAWCAMFANAALIKSGYQGTRDAAAISFIKCGTPSGIQYGCIIVLRHPSGKFHVTFFHSWKDESNKLMNCLGGNQNNAVQITTYDVSGNKFEKDEVVASRMPIKI